MLLSIDICSDIVYLAEGSVTNGIVSISKCDEAKLPVGTVEDGDIKNHTALVTTISKLLTARSYKAGSAVLTFTSSSVFSRRLDLPNAKPREISAMVQNQMVQSVNDPTEYVFEYSYSDSTLTKDKTVGVWAYALDKDFVEKYFAVFKGLKFRPAALDIHCNCIEKLLLGANVNGCDLKGNSVLLVDIEHEFVEIHLLSGGERAFSRISPVSVSEFLMIAENLGYGSITASDESSGNYEAFTKSEQKESNSNDTAANALDISPEALLNDSILADAAHQYTGRLADELQKMVQFQLRRDSSSPVSLVYVYGTFSGLKGLCANLSPSLTCPVETINNISNVKIKANVKLAKYINAIGALIRF